jgi:signal transduction histidine kinase
VTETQALELLKSPRSEDRLLAARYFIRRAAPEHLDYLRQRLSVEKVYWVRNALRTALRTAGDSRAIATENTPQIVEPEADEELVAVATETAAAMLLHEMSPVIGRLEVYAAQEVQNYDASNVRRQIQQLKYKLESIAKLGNASAVPIAKEFDLGGMIRRVIDETAVSESAQVTLAGQDGITVSSDERLVELVLAQGLKNAAEVAVAAEMRRQLLVAWGRTDRDYWFRVADNGPGPSASLDELAQLGTTSKAGHIGAGLSIALRAAKSLTGTLQLMSRESGGAAYEFRWPRPR